MHTITVTTFDDWRQAARDLLALGQGPEAVMFRSQSAERPTLGLTFDDTPRSTVAPAAATNVPRAFLELARTVACHRDPGRWDLLYRTLWRLTHGEPELLEVITDDDVIRLTRMEKAVSRDAHKAKAFVRFRRIAEGEMEQYVAWHRPDHLILPLVAPFFARRFPEMAWSILTPDASVLWDGESLHFGEGVPASAAPQGDALEELWKTYYGSIFNPARIKLRAMKREMPVRHWETLPETRIIPDLLADAPRRLETMARQTTRPVESAAAFLPAPRDLASLATAAACCQGCDLHSRATQTVFGRGPGDARIVLIGEQPGDQEDRQGAPFVGPAGEVLDRALAEVGLARERLYVTNVVKHFKFEPRGKRRIHQTPRAPEINACRPWIEAELALIKPEVLVCLGATAARALISSDFRILKERGRFVSGRWAPKTLATLHPSAVLRGEDDADQARLYAMLVEDLRLVASAIR